jgi:hypothetical protein
MRPGYLSDYDIGNYSFGLFNAVKKARKTIMKCESHGYKFAECDAGFPAGNAKLVKKFSKSACVKNRSFGVKENMLWVDKGCRGNFEVLEKIEPVKITKPTPKKEIIKKEKALEKKKQVLAKQEAALKQHIAVLEQKIAQEQAIRQQSIFARILSLFGF